GTNIAGTADLGNAGDGVQITQGASNNTVGGSFGFLGNLISGNNSAGVGIGRTLGNPAGSNNQVLSNKIGTNFAGTAAIGNTFEGVIINDNAGATLVTDNLISGNLGNGVGIVNSSGSTFQRNRIGTAADGVSPLGNGGAGVGFGTSFTVCNNNLIG